MRIFENYNNEGADERYHEQPKTNETKKRIVKTAFHLYREKGCDSVTINEICEASGVSKHTFYYYFKTKDEVLESFMIIPYEIRAERLHSILTAENYFEQYWLLAEPVPSFFKQNGPEMTRHYFITKSRRNPGSIRGCERKDKEILELTLLKKSQNAAEIRNQSNPEDLFRIGFQLLMSSAFSWSLTRGECDLLNVSRAALEVAFDLKPEYRKANLQAKNYDNT